MTERDCRCGAPLATSVHMGTQWKSCPWCSQKAGYHVFYHVDVFGERDCNGTVRLQSWCSACRGGRDRPTIASTCAVEAAPIGPECFGSSDGPDFKDDEERF